MSPYEKLVMVYAGHGLDLGQYVRLHLAGGFVFSTPEFFVMGRAVDRTAPGTDIRNPSHNHWTKPPDAWWVHGFSGDMAKLLSVEPWPLPWLGFERFDAIVRFYPIDRIIERAKYSQDDNRRKESQGEGEIPRSIRR